MRRNREVLWLHAYLDPVFKASLFLFVLSLTCDLYTRVDAQADDLSSTTPVYDYNAKLGKLDTLTSSSVAWGLEALKVTIFSA
jgi:hypothetical protein